MAKSLDLFFMSSLLLIVLPMMLATMMKPQPDLVGSYEPIKNVSDPNIQSLGEFAVNEHNKQAKSELQFQKVISGVFQIVAGTNYKLGLTAIDGTVNRTYGTIVYNDLKDVNHLIDFFSIPN